MSSGPASVGANCVSVGPMMTGQGPASYPSVGGGSGVKMPSSPFPDLSSPRMTNSSLGLSDLGGGSGPNFPATPSDNMPLNPVGTPGGGPGGMGPSPGAGGPPGGPSGTGAPPGKMTPFDPISSMAQMSQQLTSQVSTFFYLTRIQYFLKNCFHFQFYFVIIFCSSRVILQTISQDCYLLALIWITPIAVLV